MAIFDPEHIPEYDAEISLGAYVDSDGDKEQRQVLKINADLMLSRLEHECVSRGMDQEPKFFRSTITRHDSMAQQVVLTVPTQSSHHTPSYFIGVNVVGRHPSVEKTQRLSTVAYRFLPGERYLIESPTYHSDRPEGEASWPFEKGNFGPFIVDRDSIIDVRFWKKERLETPATLPPRLSFEYGERAHRAGRVLQILRAIHDVDEVERFTLVSDEL